MLAKIVNNYQGMSYFVFGVNKMLEWLTAKFSFQRYNIDYKG